MNKTSPLTQDFRPPCSLPMNDADLSLDNSNWTKGLQAMTDWIWSANLNPAAFPNHLGRYFLHIPGIFEQQLNFSTSLIFDEPSFRNGVQVSGFVNRVHKELVINLIAQVRRAWYTMTHHAILGTLTAAKHSISAERFADQLFNLENFAEHPELFTPLETEILHFALAFATDPKSYTDEQMEKLKTEFKKYNSQNFERVDYPILRAQAAEMARSEALLKGIALDSEDFTRLLKNYTSAVSSSIPPEMNDQKVNAQIVELAFLCLQFVALACVFTGLNIPDESFLPDVMKQLLPSRVIQKINELNEQGLEGNHRDLLPKPIQNWQTLTKAIGKGQLKVTPARLKGARIPLTPYEGKDDNGAFRPAFAGMPDRDKGLTVGGVQVGVYGWSFGGHFPGSLVYCLMHHPELARYEAPYSLPLLFNEDEWRNGVQTAGFISRKLKELIIQKVYKHNRSRYGLEHHTMFLYNSFMDEYGVGRNKNANFNAAQQTAAREKALKHAEAVVLHILDHEDAPHGTFSQLEEAALTWTYELICTPHSAYGKEEKLRSLLRENNHAEIKAGLRRLDNSPGIGEDAAMDRLIDHQIAEMIMLIGHMDGLGRLLTILQLEAEDAVQTVEGSFTNHGGIKPQLDANGQVVFTGYFNNRPALHDVLKFIGISENALSLNELLVNPGLCTEISTQLQNNPNQNIEVNSIENGTPEF